MNQAAQTLTSSSAGFLKAIDNYAIWRDTKLERFRTRLEDMIVEIRNPLALSSAEFSKIQSITNSNNAFIYCLSRSDPKLTAEQSLLALNRQLGLHNAVSNPESSNNNISKIYCRPAESPSRFIPYTNKALQWHTDGYYNGTNQTVRAFALHCVCPAISGGQNAILDHEIAYIQIRENNPDLAEFLFLDDCFTIPADTDENGNILRAEFTGPVFSIDPHSINPATDQLYMRYSQRKRNISWNPNLSQALQEITNILSDQNPSILHFKLQPGEGLVCNNVLHSRTAFCDSETEDQRMLLRIRYQDRLFQNSGQ